jgi:hypothetical protein
VINQQAHKKILSEALRAAKLNHKAPMVFTEYPNLYEACEQLAGVLTLHFPGENLPLLQETLTSSFEAYEKSLDDDTSYPLSVFLIALVSCAPAMIGKRLTTKGGQVAWIPFKETAYEFVKRNGEAGLSFVDDPDPELVNASSSDAMYMLASQILTLHDFKCVREYLTTRDMQVMAMKVA